MTAVPYYNYVVYVEYYCKINHTSAPFCSDDSDSTSNLAISRPDDHHCDVRWAIQLRINLNYVDRRIVSTNTFHFGPDFQLSGQPRCYYQALVDCKYSAHCNSVVVSSLFGSLE